MISSLTGGIEAPVTPFARLHQCVVVRLVHVTVHTGRGSSESHPAAHLPSLPGVPTGEFMDPENGYGCRSALRAVGVRPRGGGARTHVCVYVCVRAE